MNMWQIALGAIEKPSAPKPWQDTKPLSHRYKRCKWCDKTFLPPATKGRTDDFCEDECRRLYKSKAKRDARKSASVERPR